MINIPSSTYRVQLNSEFKLSDLEKIATYLKELGISTIYASPLFKALPGSSHGYDVTDPCIISDEIGTLEEFRKISQQFKSMGINWLQDIVPNHMAFSINNNWIYDVLERGKASEFYVYFDILPKHTDPRYSDRLMVPFLGAELGDAIANNEISLCLDTSKGFIIQTPGESYPVSLCSYQLLSNSLKDQGVFIEELGPMADAGLSGPQAAWKEVKSGFLEKNKYRFEEILTAIDRINENKELLNVICESQYYILTNWKLTHSVINYRRFFTVNVLICLAMEKEKTFSDYHRFVKELFDEGIIHGVRIDHIDGLKRPGEYLDRLRSLLGKDCYIIIEKILSGNEVTSPLWDIQGTSGYEFLSFVNNLLTDVKGATELREFYHNIVRVPTSYRENIFNSKMFILKNHMRGELDNLIDYLQELNLVSPEQDLHRLSEALAIFMCLLPIYRIYPERYPLEQEDMRIIDATYGSCLQQSNNLSEEFRFLHSLFIAPENQQNEKTAPLQFIQRLMQFTGPLTAKGVEDTAFYNYNPLISHNEVGDSPSTLGQHIEEFHNKMLFRQKMHPHSLNATSTHDTKRGEDSRVRINLLSEFADEWMELFRQWHEVNLPFKKKIGNKEAPSVNGEYFIYQSLIGGIPTDLKIDDTFIGRLKEYVMKAMREAKFNTNWDDPSIEYENAVFDFIDQILDQKSEFLQTLKPFLKKILQYGYIYSLTQTLVKMTAPGIPDIYQGAETWDLSFVDPDNRSQIDFDLRKNMLTRITELGKSNSDELLRVLKAERPSGIEKLFLVNKTLLARKRLTSVFTDGEYIPVYPRNSESSVISYFRKYGNEWALVVSPLQLADKNQEQDFDAKNYDTIELSLPADVPGKWRNEFTGEDVNIDGTVALASLLQKFPVALLTSIS